MPVDISPTSNPEQAYESAKWTVYDAMPFIEMSHLLNPTTDRFEACLARHVIMFILIEKMDIPKRRVATLMGISREVWWRVSNPETGSFHNRMQERRFRQFVEQVSEAAIERFQTYYSKGT